jgi:hypothetical protein
MNNWPSTTQVLKDAGLYGDIERFGDAESMRRGRLVDAACNLLLMEKEIPASWYDQHPECEPYIAGYQHFLIRHKVRLIQCAFEVVNKAERYIGHPDQLIMLDDVQAMIDIKTGGMPKTTALQTASYELAERSMGVPRSIRVGLQLVGGDFKLHYFTNPADFDEWTILVRAHWIKAKYGNGVAA